MSGLAIATFFGILAGVCFLALLGMASVAMVDGRVKIVPITLITLAAATFTALAVQFGVSA